jgi:AraC family transcriptional regulator
VLVGSNLIILTTAGVSSEYDERVDSNSSRGQDRLTRSIAPVPALAARQWEHAAARFCREPASIDGFIDAAVEVHHLVLVKSGGFRAEMREVGTARWQHFDVAPGEICVAGAGAAPHEMCWRSSTPGSTIDVIDFYLDPTALRVGEENVALPGVAAHWRVLSDPLLKELLLGLGGALTGIDSAEDLFGEVATQLIALQLSRAHSDAKELQPLRRGGLTPVALRRVREFVAAHLRQEIRLEQLAAVAGLSAYHFARAFKLSTGLSPHAFVVHCRIEEAKRLLTETTLPIIEIASRSGFSGPSQFSTRFRAVTKRTPSAHRQLARR